jgi:hypothetical protein
MRNKFFFVIAMVFAAFFITGCASGPKYTPISPVDVPGDKALVYIYRTAIPIGVAVAYEVMAGEQKVVSLQNGGYYPCLVTPGSVEFWAMTEAKSSVTLNLEAGKTYYIRGSVTMGFFVGHPLLEIIPADQAEKEISQCVLIPAGI